MPLLWWLIVMVVLIACVAVTVAAILYHLSKARPRWRADAIRMERHHQQLDQLLQQQQQPQPRG